MRNPANINSGQETNVKIDAKAEKKEPVTAKEIAYYLFWGILFAAKGVGLTEGDRLFSLCLLAALLCLAVKLCLTAHSVQEWAVMAALVSLGLLMRKSSGDKAAYWAMLIIIGMKDVPVKRLLKLCLGIWSITFAASVTLGILHIRDGVVVVHDKLGLGPLVRWSLGYTHPNVLHVSYFILAALLLYCFEWHGKKLVKASALLMLGNLAVFLYSISYTGILLVSGYLVLNLYLDQRKKLYAGERILFTAAAAALICLPIAAPFWLNVHDHRLFMFLNELLSYRFEQVWNFFHDYPVSLFGTRIVYTGNAHLTLDSSFAYLLMYYGILGSALFVFWLLYLVDFFTKRQRKKELAMLLAIIVAGVTEQFLFNLSFKNLSLLFMGETLFGDILCRGDRERWWKRPFFLIPATERWEERWLAPVLARWQKTVSGWRQIAGRSSSAGGSVPSGRKWILRIACAGAVCGLMIALFMVRMPDSVFVARNLTDHRGEDRVTLDLEKVPEDFNSLVIGYQGPEGELFEFTGNIVKLEKVRNAVGYTFLGGMAGALLGGLFFGVWKNQRFWKSGSRKSD